MSYKLRIGIAGLGTVGVGVVRILQENGALLASRCGKELELVAVSARSQKDRGVDLSGVRFEEDARTLAAADDIDMVVELIGGDEGVARELVEQALANGKEVVTANKALIAKHGAAMAEAAEKSDVTLGFEAAVAGGTPILAMLREGLSANRITRVSGILNGTCNFILTEMEKRGCDYEVMLKEAEELGYLEADPRLDIDGIDTAHKLAILAAIGFGKAPHMDGVDCTGISEVGLADVRYAASLGYRIKLVGRAEMIGDKVLQIVCPMLVPHSAPLASVESSYNAIEVHGDHVERIFLQGRGAGPGPTASAVVADIVAAARGTQAAPFSLNSEHLEALAPADADDFVSRHYLRLRVKDEPGVLAKIAELCNAQGVSVEELRQDPTKDQKAADIVITTHAASSRAMKQVIAGIVALDANVSKPVWIRVEEA